MISKIDWNIKNLIPKFLKHYVEQNYYKTNFLKDFTIVSMLRDFASINLKTNKIDNSIIINKNLIIKPIETKNLTTTFTKSIEDEKFKDIYNIEVYKIVIHINNKFNPTNIELLDKKSNIHFYHLQGDNTLHVNIGLLTLFEIISNENLKETKRKSNMEGDYYKHNSNLSLAIENLIRSQIITLYKQESNNEIVWESEYYLFDEVNNDPLKFSYNSELDVHWRYLLKDIPIFIHNIWWDVILILINIYELKIWKSKDKSGSTSNNFRLKTTILQLLGGFSKLNMFERVDEFVADHYVVVNKNYENIINFVKKLTKLDKRQKKIS